MRNQLISGLATVLFPLSLSMGAGPAEATVRQCITIAGTISATVTSPAEAENTVVQGTVTGTLGGSVEATITSILPQEDGTLALELNHNFVTEEGFLLRTQDTAVLTPVEGLPGVFQQSTRYEIVGGTGRFARATGRFINHGETDLNRGLLTLRYEGEICKVAR